jgi:hypothetical protein
MLRASKRAPCLFFHFAGFALLFIIFSFPFSSHAKKPTIFFKLQGIREPKGAKPSLKAKAKKILLEELKKQPQVLTDLGSTTPASKAALAKILQARKLTGYAIMLRITKVKHSMNPPAAGKVYKVLMVEVEVAIDAEKIPSGQMALAGQGSTQVGTEVSRFKEKERLQLIYEALQTATNQAVTKSLSKLAPGKKRRGKQRRRRKR